MIKVFPVALLLCACSAVPLKFHCEELRMRMDNTSLSGDQLRFAKDELTECEKNLKQAELKDSLKVEQLNDTFTPADSLSPAESTTHAKP